MKHLFGWTGRILKINLSNGAFSNIPTLDYAPSFVGGRGVASRLYLDEVGRHVGAFSTDNHLFFMTGPLCGTTATASSRWIVLGKSPLAFPEQYAFGSLGGRFGAQLKWSGFDGLDISGASKKPVVLVVEPDGRCTIEDAAHLVGKDVFETIQLLKKAFGPDSQVATIGKAGENRVRFATVMGSEGVSASKGFGAVMGSKNLKAVVVKNSKRTLGIARKEQLKKVTKEARALWQGEETSERYWIDAMLVGVEKFETAFCYACPGICGRGKYQDKKARKGYVKNCISAYYYALAEKAKSGLVGEASFFATQLANRHGLCTNELRFLVEWVPKALDMGIIDPKETGLATDEVGTEEWIETLVEMIVHRQGQGDLLAEGSKRAARELACDDLLDGMVTRTGFDADLYNPRFFNSLAPIYATEPVHPITQLHGISFPMVKWMIWMGTEGMMGSIDTENIRELANTFWGDTKAAEFDTPEKKGQAAAIMQNRAYAKENFVFCDFFWPIDYSGNTKTGVGDPGLEAALFTAVTGEDMDETGYMRLGERCCNLARAIYLLEGRRGIEDDVLEPFNHDVPLENQASPVGLFNPDLMLPGKDGETFSAKGQVLKRDVFRYIMNDYYDARGWDKRTGLPTKKRLASLDLRDLIPELDRKGLLAL